MPVPEPGRPGRRPLTRADLPAELTPETLRGLGFSTLRHLADPRNGVLDAGEQEQFDRALAEVVRGTSARLDETLSRSRREGPGPFDPAMRRSYQRTQRRLVDQARRARSFFPELAPEQTDEPVEPLPDAPTETRPDARTDAETDAGTDDLSPRELEQEVEQTSDTLDMLERIASLQQQQLEHQESQLLTETRGVFFAFLVSVAVIVAGVAPLVEAEPHERLEIVLWTVAVVAVAGLVYALVRRLQQK